MCCAVPSRFSHVWLCDPMDCSPPGSSGHGIFPARILESVAISSSRGSSQPKDRSCVSCIAGIFLTTEPPGKLRDRPGPLQRKKEDGKTERNLNTVFKESLTPGSTAGLLDFRWWTWIYQLRQTYTTGLKTFLFPQRQIIQTQITKMEGYEQHQ